MSAHFTDKTELQKDGSVRGDVGIYLVDVSPAIASRCRSLMTDIQRTLTAEGIADATMTGEEMQQKLQDIKEHCEEAAGTEDAKYINKAFDRICDAVGVSNHWWD